MAASRRGGLAAGAAACLLALSACGSAGTDASGELTVLAASSLTDAFSVIGEQFETAHPGTTVRFAFAGSQQLATQVIEGAPADVFASADTAQMDRVVAAGAVAGAPRPVAANRLAIAVEPGNPGGITGLTDLADPRLVVVLAAAEVPAGHYARELLDAAGVTVHPDSLEPHARAVLGRVVLGEADAGIVYASDVVAAGDDVDQVAITDHHDVAATYPIARMADALHPELADDFVAFVQSEPARAVLVAHGFAPVR